MKVTLLVNFSANNNSAQQKWLSIRNEVLRQLPGNTKVITYTIPFDVVACLKNIFNNQTDQCIISAGGDGSINFIVNAILRHFPKFLSKIHLGAIGFGSSNDFLKPFDKKINDIPVKINLDRSKWVDIGQVRLMNIESKPFTKYFVINSSIGVTADANNLFNKGDLFLKKTKVKNVHAAIIYTAVKTILRYNNKSLLISYQNESKEIMATNISVIKNPHISGSFKYDQVILPDDGFLGLNICFGMNKLELIKVLFDLSNGHFSGKPKRCSCLVRTVAVISADDIAVETDGEITFAREAYFSILPDKLSILYN